MVNIMLLITQSCLSIAQVSSSFEHLKYVHVTPIFINEALCIVTYAQLDIKVTVMAYTVLDYSYKVSFYNYVCVYVLMIPTTTSIYKW